MPKVKNRMHKTMKYNFVVNVQPDQYCLILVTKM